MKNLVIAVVCLGLGVAGVSAKTERFGMTSVSRTIEGILPYDQLVTFKMTLSESGYVAFEQKVGELSSFIVSLEKKEIPQFEAILKKMLGWEEIAIDKQVEHFEKILGQIGKQDVVFSYSYPDAPAQITWRGATIGVKQAELILLILPQLESAEQQLAAVQANQKKQSALFD